jgi:DNA modification methylase
MNGHERQMTVTILKGDCREVLATLPDDSAHCVVTSPPYWGLRDYGTATWKGGDAECDHSGVRLPGENDKSASNRGSSRDPVSRECRKCGARRIDSQIGLEPTPEAYVATMVEVFREVRRVLRSDGTVWLNLGDSYATGTGSGRSMGGQCFGKQNEVIDAASYPICQPNRMPIAGLKPKDLCGIPWRVAFALQADGWWLRQDIIWSKPNPMPESVTDRCTKAHEYIFLLSKSARYYYDAAAIAEPFVDERLGNPGNYNRTSQAAKGANRGAKATRNKRSVWEVATAPFSEAHFATFPPSLIEPCIKAGTSEKGCCAKCGAPWLRESIKPQPPAELRNRGNGSKMDFHSRQTGSGQKLQDWYDANPGRTIGWSPSCSCHADVMPCRALDPFGGAGTTGLVADRLGRDAVLIELNPEYAAMSECRIKQDAGMFADVHS